MSTILMFQREYLLVFTKQRLSKKIVVEYFLWQIEVRGLKYNDCECATS